MGSESIIPSPALPPSPVAPDDDFPGLISPPSFPSSPFSCCAIVSPPPPFLASVCACSTLSPRDGGGGVVALCTSPVRPFARKESCTHSLPGFPSPPPLLLLLLLLAATPSLLLLLRPLAVAALRRFLAVILAEREREREYVHKEKKLRKEDRRRHFSVQQGRRE